MPSKRLLILLSSLVVTATGAAMYRLSDVQLSSYGSIVAGAGSLLAVIWFTGSLWYQSQQLLEQRTQFLAEFKQLREDGRRNALLLARDILITAESRALAINPKISSLSELPTLYLTFVELKDMLESNDPDVVQAASQGWMKKEGPASILMRGLKSAAEVYFVALGKEGIDYSKEPEDFVLVYGPELRSLPFFEAYQAPARILAEFMFRLEPARKAVLIAALAAVAKGGGSKFLKMDTIRKDIEAHVAKGYPLPKIAEGL